VSRQTRDTLMAVTRWRILVWTV